MDHVVLLHVAAAVGLAALVPWGEAVSLPPVIHVEVQHVPPEDTESEDELSRDAAYIGSMTFAGLGLFGSSLLARIFGINKSAPRPRRIAVFMVTTGSFGMVAIHLGLAARICCFDSWPPLWFFLVLSFALALVACVGYVYLAQTHFSNTPGQK